MTAGETSNLEKKEASISAEIESDLYAYVGGIIREIGGVALCINGIPDHIHLLVRMPTTLKKNHISFDERFLWT